MAFRGQTVRVVGDRPLGSVHPRYPDLVYPINYGYVPGVWAGDGHEQDAYLLGSVGPMLEAEGTVIAVIVRRDDVENKWVVVTDGKPRTKEEIRKATWFQERFFDSDVFVIPH